MKLVQIACVFMYCLVQKLAQCQDNIKYAPIVYFHSGESYWPSSVDYFLQNVQIKSRSGSVVSGQPDPLTSSNIPSGYKAKFLTTKSSLGCDSCTDPSFLDGQKPTSSSSPPTYAVTVTVNASTSTVDTFYWFFYPYNKGKRVCIGYYADNVCPCFKVWGNCVCPRLNGCIGFYSDFGNHVGDWEHITVRTVAGQPHSLYLSAHSFGGAYTWDGSRYAQGSDYVEVENDHPVVYAAKGSHGIWSTAGSHVYKDLFNGDSLVDKTEKSLRLDTWNNLRGISYRSNAGYSGDQSWMNFKGRWGNKKDGCGLFDVIEEISGECVLNSGPTGPQWKSKMSSSDLDKRIVDVAASDGFDNTDGTETETGNVERKFTGSEIEDFLEKLIENEN